MKIYDKMKLSLKTCKQISTYRIYADNDYKSCPEHSKTSHAFYLLLIYIISVPISSDGYFKKKINISGLDFEELKSLCDYYNIKVEPHEEEVLFLLSINDITSFNRNKKKEKKVKVLKNSKM